MRVFYLAPFRCRKCRLRFYRPTLFWFPTSAEAVRIPVTSNVPVPRTGPLVLILDDDRALRSLFRRLLERDGYQVYEASNRAEISDDSSEGNLDLVIANLNSTGEDNLATARTLQATNPDLKVIILSNEIKARALQSQAVQGKLAILETPLHPHDLMDTVRELLGRGVAVGRH